jgi:Tfp pilus assembly protein PilN
MIRINLLPPEIVQKRKSEGLWIYIGLAFLFVALVLGLAFVALLFVASGLEDDVAQAESEAQRLQAEAQQYAVFEESETDLQNREQMVEAALANHVDLTRLFEELSLVMPPSTWLDSLAFDDSLDKEGPADIVLNGFALDPPDDTPDKGFKPVANTLVRLVDLEQLYNVWLTGTAKDAGIVDENDNVIMGTVTYSISSSVRTEEQVKELEQEQELDPGQASGQ